MHAVLNWLFMTPQAGGVGTAAREVVPRMLAADASLRLTIVAGAEADPVRENAEWAREVEWVRLPVTVTHGPPLNVLRTVGAQWLAQPLLARRRKADVLHGMANMGALVAPGVATVTTLHDLIWMAYPTVLRRRDRLVARCTTIPAARAADLVLTDSHAAKQAAVARLRLASERIAVVPLGAGRPHAQPVPEAVLRAKLGLADAPVVLVVAQHRAHKNLEGVVRALATLGRPEVRVVVAGAPTPHGTQLQALAVALGVRDQLVFPAWLEQDELEGLYALARCVLLASFEEGFGLPVLEAMVRGVPVACSGVGALAELAGAAAERFDPWDPVSIAAAVGVLLDDHARRAELREAGRKRARLYTWERAAEATLAAYRVAIERRRLLNWDR